MTRKRLIPLLAAPILPVWYLGWYWAVGENGFFIAHFTILFAFGMFITYMCVSTWLDERR